MLSRREFLAAVASLPLAATTARAADGRGPAMGIVIHSYGIHARLRREQGFGEPLEFLQFCRQRGAASVQLPLGVRDDAYCAQLRERCRQWDMGLEAIVRMPADVKDVERLEAEIRTAQSAGATVARTVLLSGRRYEVFRTLQEYREFEARSRAQLTLVRPVVEKFRFRLAVENHKDYRAADLSELIRSQASEFIGVCVDTGNNIALLEDPLETAKVLAPHAMACHFKDMAVHEYDEGFLLSEVPLGAGFLDLKQIIRVLRAARPELRLHLEMMTRDPLRVPCLAPQYWATLPEFPAREFSAALARVRRNAHSHELPRVSGLKEQEQLAAEDSHVVASMTYARKELA